MMLKQQLLLLFLTIGIFTISFSNSVEKGYKYLDKGKGDKAKEVFKEFYEKNNEDILANYGLYLVYKTNLAEKAHPYVLHVEELLKIKKGQKITSDRISVSYSQAKNERKQLEKVILQFTLRQNNLMSILYFIKKYPKAHNLELAIIRRNEMAFQEVRKEHTVQSYNRFLEKYPKAEQHTEVENLRNQLIYEEVTKTNTIENYKWFIKKYPTAKEIYRATKARDKLIFDEVLKENSAEAFADFVRKYPDADQVSQANKLHGDRVVIEHLEQKNKILKQEKEIQEMGKKQAELLQQQQQKDLETEKHKKKIYIALFSVVGILFVILIVAFVGQRRAKQQIAQQNEEIEQSKQEILIINKDITQKNKEIVDSINYAKVIQTAILPSKKRIKNHFKDAFVFYRPKDIVSGDFYWYGEVEDKQIIAAVDCTGHGVPGAFMSMIGNTILNQIVLRSKITKPSEILFNLRQEVIKALAQSHIEDDSGDTRKDGMDIALCTIEKNKVEFAGAFNPMILVRNDEVIQVKADRMPIGDYLDKNNHPFTNHEYTISKGDSIYLFTDGYPDQFGGENDKKIGSKAFRELLVEVSSKTADDQEIHLNKYIQKWMGKTSQIDDMLIIGMKF